MKIISLGCFFIALLFSSCKNSITKQVEMTTEKFDIATFEKNKVDGEYNFVLDDGTKVRQLSSKLDYGEFIIPPPPELFETRCAKFVTSCQYNNVTTSLKQKLYLK